MVALTAAISTRVAVTLSWLTFLISAVLLFLPFWLTDKTPRQTLAKGLYLHCFDDLSGCTLVDLSKQTGWYQACAGMWTGGCVVLLACALGAMFMCCSCCRGRGCATILTIGAFFASGLLISTVVLYGIKQGNLFDRSGTKYYEWGFYSSWGAALLSLITSAVFSCSIYQIGRIDSMYY